MKILASDAISPGAPLGAAYGIAGGFLAALFSLRVLGQMVQRWLPQPFLPPFNSFQGSNLPYWVLLSVQIVILALMIWLARGMHRAALTPRRSVGVWLTALGGAYMVAAVGRIATGFLLPAAHPWFRAWIPAWFHIVLAGFVLTVSTYHLRRSIVGERQ